MDARLQAAPMWAPRLRYWLENLGFLGAGLFALALTLWHLADNGYANLYYAAAVKSMAANGHAFFFVSLDPAGFVSIDKPPLGFWLQVLSVSLFGFTPFALLLPQALAGAIAPPLLGLLVRRGFGGVAGLLAACTLALTPIWIVSARANIVDGTLALTLLLAAAALLQAVALGVRPRRKRTAAPEWMDIAWLGVAFILVGIGFNIKMLEAFLAVPPLALTYLLYARGRLPRRLGALLLALGMLLVVSLAWVSTVDLTPPNQRPYVGSTSSNSELDLAFGYNGLGRLLGRKVEAGAPLEFAPPVPSTRVGAAGPFRFIQPELGAQMSWLLPLALLGLVAAWPFMPSRPSEPATPATPARPSGRRRDRPAADQDTVPLAALRKAALLVAGGAARERMRRAGYVLWVIWLVTGLVALSVARFIDSYYLAVAAPALAAAVGFGGVALWRAYLAPGWRGWLFPAAILATFGEQAYLALSMPDWAYWLTPLLAVIGVWVTTALVIARATRWQHTAQLGISPGLASGLSRYRRPLLSGLCWACLGLSLAAPTLWTLTSLTWGNAGFHPIAGPKYAHEGISPMPHLDPQLLSYLQAHRDGARYLVAVRDSTLSAPLILATGAPVMTMGGYSGDDPILTVDMLRQLAATNTVRFFLLPSSNVTLEARAALYAAIFHGERGALRGPAYQSSGPLYQWIAAQCAPLPPPVWSSAGNARRQLPAQELFDCKRLEDQALAGPAGPEGISSGAS